MEEQGLGEADAGGGVEEGNDVVVGGVREEDFAEDGRLAEAAGAAVLGVLVAVEGVVGDLAEIAATENESPEREVEGVEKAVPVLGAEKLLPCRFDLGGRHGNINISKKLGVLEGNADMMFLHMNEVVCFLCRQVVFVSNGQPY